MSKDSSLIPVHIAQWGHNHLMYLPLYAAIRSGKAKKLGLDITLTHAGNDDQIFNQVATGKADFGFGDPIFVEIGLQKGIKAVCVAMAVKRAAIWGITHNPTIPLLNKVEDFVQLRIGTFPKPSTVYALIEGLKHKHKRLLKYMQIVEAPIGQQAQLLTKNKADVVIELEPMVSLAEAKGMRAVFSLAQFYGDSAFTGLMALEKTVNQKPHVVEAVIQALQYGLDICLKDRKKALKIAEEVFPDYPKEILDKAIQRLNAHGVWSETTSIDRKNWKTAVKLRQKVGDL